MLTGKTKTGYEFEINPDNLFDYELVELLAEVDANPLLLPKLLTVLLGEMQKKELIEHVRTEDGKVPLTALTDEVADIFQAGQASKNS